MCPEWSLLPGGSLLGRSAVLAAFRIVREPELFEVFLFASGEWEVRSAIAALKGPVFEHREASLRSHDLKEYTSYTRQVKDRRSTFFSCIFKYTPYIHPVGMIFQTEDKGGVAVGIMKLSAGVVGDLKELPDARTVRDIYGYVDIGTHRVAYHNTWGDERFPWRVYGPRDTQGFSEVLDEFPQYREAVAFAKQTQRKS